MTLESTLYSPSIVSLLSGVPIQGTECIYTLKYPSVVLLRSVKTNLAKLVITKQ